MRVSKLKNTTAVTAARTKELKAAFPKDIVYVREIVSGEIEGVHFDYDEGKVHAAFDVDGGFLFAVYGDAWWTFRKAEDQGYVPMSRH